MATKGNGNKPYDATLRGRLEALLASLTAFLRRSGAGSIAIAIGALGAAALLATTLIFPPPPVQRIFQTDAGNEGIQAPASPDGTGSDEPITVPTGPTESDQVADNSDGSTNASTPQVLGTFTENGSVAGGSNGSGGDTITGSTTTGPTPSLDEDGAQPGSGSGSEPDVDGDTTTTKEDDDDDVREEKDDDDDTKSKDSKQKKNYQDDTDYSGSKDSKSKDSKDSGSKDSKSKDSDDSDDD